MTTLAVFRARTLLRGRATIAAIRLPVCPVHAPERTRSAKSAMRSSTA